MIGSYMQSAYRSSTGSSRQSSRMVFSCDSSSSTRHSRESVGMIAATDNPMLSTADTNEFLLFQPKTEPVPPSPEIAPVKSRSRTNQGILIFTSLAFFLFLVAEIVGALVSGSLSLLGDAFAMSVDVFSVSFLSPFYYVKAFDNPLTQPPFLIYTVRCQHVCGKIESRRKSVKQANSDYS